MLDPRNRLILIKRDYGPMNRISRGPFQGGELLREKEAGRDTEACSSSFSWREQTLAGTSAVIKGASFLPAPSQLVSSAATRAFHFDRRSCCFKSCHPGIVSFAVLVSSSLLRSTVTRRCLIIKSVSHFQFVQNGTNYAN